MIEPLESRIAPAAVLTFTDLDGDLVTISSSKGTLAQLQSAAGDLSDHRLQSLNLVGVAAFDGANISITAKQQGGKGDGFVNVGSINAIGRVLGAVTVDGDLGEIDAGTFFTSPTALQSLTVQSLGLLGTSTGATDLRSDIAGTVKSITVKGEVVDAAITISGGSGSTIASLGALTIGGSLRVATSLAAARINVDGNIGPVKIGGSVIGGGQASTGQIGSINGSIASVAVGGDVVGGAAGFSGYIFAKYNIGNVTIGGNLKGGGTAGGDGNSGLISAGSGNIGDVKIGGSVIGGASIYCGTIAASTSAESTGRIGNVTIGGSVIGGTDSFAGMLRAASAIGNVSIRGDLAGNMGDYSASIYINPIVKEVVGKLGNVTIGGTVTGGVGDNSGSVFVETPVSGSATLGSITIGGSLKGGVGTSSGSITGTGQSGERAGAIKIGGDVFAAGGQWSGRVFVSNVTTINIGGSVLPGSGSFAGYWGGSTLGTFHVGGDFGARLAYNKVNSIVIDGSLVGSSESRTGNISGDLGTVVIGRDIRGGNSGADDREASGAITAFSIKSVVVGGSLIAGQENGSGNITNSGSIVAGTIGSVTVKGSIVGNFNTTANVTATTSLKSVTVAGRVEFGYISTTSGGSQIGTVSVAGDWIASSITAGVNTVDGRVGDGNDIRAGGGNASVASKIASIAIAGQIWGYPPVTNTLYGFGAEEIGSFRVHSAVVPLLKTAHTETFAGAGTVGKAIAVGAAASSLMNDARAVHIFEI